MPFVGLGVGVGRQRFASGIFAAYAARVAADGGVTEAGACVNAVSGISLNSSLLLVPSGYKSGVVYSQIPTNGDGDLTFTRASDATRVNSDGEIEVVGSGVPRLDYSQGSCPALLLEPQRTNSVLYSNLRTNWSITSADFSASDATILNNEGRTLSVINTINGVDYSRGLRQAGLSLQITTGTTRAVSFYVKKTGTNSTFGFYMIGTAEYSAIFNVDTNTRLSSYSSGLTRVGFNIENLGNGIYRCTDIITATADRTYTSVVLGFATGINTQTTGMTGEFMGLQFEEGAYATSYIPTTSATVTRLRDSFTRDNIYTNGLISASGGTWYVELKNNVAYVRDVVMRIGVGDNVSLNSNSIYLFPSSNGRLIITKSISGSTTSLLTTTTDNIKIAIKWNGTTADVFVNGVKQVSATAFTTTIMENLLSTTMGVPVFIQAMQLYPTPLSDSDCISLTTL